MSPAELKTLLHIHTIPEPLENKGAIPELEKWGLIKTANGTCSGWETTKRGEAMVKMLTATPLPELAFTDPRSKEVL